MTENPRVIAHVVAVEQLQSQRLRQLFEHWQRLRGSRPMPRRAELKPEDIHYAIGSVSLVEVLRNPLNFRFKLIAKRAERLGRHSDQGKLLDEIEPPFFREFLRGYYVRVVETLEPVVDRVEFAPGARPSGSLLGYERIILPLAGEGETVEFLAIASDWPEGVDEELRGVMKRGPERPHGSSL
jgi:hypothetical protein